MSLSLWQRILGGVAGLSAAIAGLLLIPVAGGHLLMIGFAVLAAASLARFAMPLSYWVDGALALLGAIAVIAGLAEVTPALWLALIATWLFAWLFIDRLAGAVA